ncbi:Transmembrane protein [Armadillidium vulgare]|nr:Transmembrane protein [Armadillidium vulgare]
MKEITRWLGITVFEILMWLVSLIITCILVLVRIEWNLLQNWSWWFFIGPVFFADVLNAYFCIIIFIRMYLSGVLKPAALRLLWSIFVLSLGFVFKFLLCKKLETHPNPNIDFSSVLAPIFIIIQLVVVRACNMN